MSAQEQLSRHYEREAESTRHSLANSLNELNRQLTPGQLFDEVLSYARGGSSTFMRAFSNAARENPVPSLLIAAGCMMFLSEKMGITGRRDGRYAADHSYGAAGETGPGLGEVAKQKVAGAAETVKQGIGAVGDSILDASARAREATHDMREGVGETVGQVREGTQRVRQRVTETAVHTGEQALQAGRQVKEKATTLMHEQPMLMAGIGLALGAALAALLPRTQTEDELMGETSDRLKEKVGAAAQQQYQTVKETASEFAGKAKEVAEREGLSAEGAAAEVVRRFGGREEGEGQAPESRWAPESPGSAGEQTPRKS